MQKKRFLAAKKAALLSVALATSTIPITSQAGIPVIDGGNLVQNILTALEAVAQTLTQIDMLAQQVEQYQTQLQQYENQLQNTLAPAASIWDSASSVIDKLIAAQNSLSYYENKLGSLNSYLDKFQDANYYRNSPCFTPQGCSDSEMKAMRDNIAMSSQAQKKTNDDLFQTVKAQRENLKADARTLERLQRAAQGAEGQLQAIGYANQLASNQTNHLLQMRSLMVAQQAAEATRRQSEIDREAQQQANFESLYRGFKPNDRSKSEGF